MGIFFLLIPVLLAIFFINTQREKRGLSSISQHYAIPIVLTIVAYFAMSELDANMGHTAIAFAIGILVGSTIEYASRK